jgi:hypothetical protein
MEAENAIVLDGIAVGVDHLQAVVVFLLVATHTYASWVRPGLGIRAPRIASAMRDAYLAAQVAADGLEPDNTSSRRPPVVVTLEEASHVVFVHRIRAFGIAIVFEREAPLGFARMAARDVVRTLDQELPYPQEESPVVTMPRSKSGVVPQPPATVPGSMRPGPFDPEPTERAGDTHPPPRSGVGDRVRAVLSHLEDHAPDPHTTLLRVALRSGLGVEALRSPEHLSSDALLLIETAAEDILGLDRGKLALSGTESQRSGSNVAPS